MDNTKHRWRVLITTAARDSGVEVNPEFIENLTNLVVDEQNHQYEYLKKLINSLSSSMDDAVKLYDAEVAVCDERYRADPTTWLGLRLVRAERVGFMLARAGLNAVKANIR